MKTPLMLLIEARHGRDIEDLLRDLYCHRQLTICEISERLGIGTSSVFRWMRRFGIETLPPRERAVV